MDEVKRYTGGEIATEVIAQKGQSILDRADARLHGVAYAETEGKTFYTKFVKAPYYDTLLLALKLICDAQVVSLGLENGESLEEIETKIAKKSLEMQNAFIEQAKGELSNEQG